MRPPPLSAKEENVMKASLRCWFCDVTVFTKSLIRLDRLSQPVFKARVQRTGFRVVRESDRREKHEAREFCTLARCF